MMEKRFEKIQTLKKEIPQPKYFGSKDADIVFVGYGSVKNSVIDAMKLTDKKIGYLHYEYLYPIKTEKLIELYENGARLIAIENNQSGELTELIKQECGFQIAEKLLKFDGRPFFVEDILDYIKQ
jgi:2-oxoglutarate ferredoxin oxidoreductase subunit alpha